MMIVAAAIVLLNVNARLALFSALALPPIAVTAFSSHTGSSPSPGSCRRRGPPHRGDRRGGRRDRDGAGVRARGRRAHTFLGRAEAVRHETMRQASVEAHYLPGLLFLPTLGIAAVLLLGGRDVIAGNLTIGEFMLFVTLLLQLVWPLEALGWIINLGQRAVASAGPELRLAGRDRGAAGGGRAAAPARRGSASGSRRSIAYGAGGEVLRGVDVVVSPARLSPSAARPAPGRRPCSTCCRASTTPPPGACSSAASTRASCRCASAGARSRS